MKKGISLILAALIGLGTIGTGTIKTNAAIVPSDATLLNTYGKEFGKIGVAIPANMMSDKNVMNATKKDYNSVTAENEMKPDAILGGTAQTMSVSQAKSMGYYIPAGYTESTVPKLNFSTMDNMLKTCYDNGLTMRGHTLVWHSQTPDWFFKSGYNNYSGYVNQATMNKRIEFYTRNVIGHVCSSKYKDVIYCWDVVNEYLHGDTESNSGWQKIYGKKLRAKAPFVKQAFENTYDALKSYGMQNKVKLFYNDYNTYMEVNDVINLINYINSDRKVCDGIGMQSHLETKYPSVAYYKAAITAFRKAGFEIQITELDVGGANQAQYCYDIMKAIFEEKKAGANITAIVWWGLSDDVSWRKGDNPLLYSKLNTPKESYKKVLQAYFDAGYTIGNDNNNSINNNNSNSNNNNNNSNNSNSNNSNNNNSNSSNNSNNNNSNNSSNNGSNSGTTQNSGKIKDGWYYIKNVHAQKYLQVKDNKGKAVQNVVLSRGTGVKGQKWYVTNTDDGYITLKSKLGDFMLDVTYGENKNGSNIQIYNAFSHEPQKFSLKSSSTNGAYVITTKCSKGTKALDNYNYGTSDGTNVCQWIYGGKANQQWVFEAVK